MALFSNIGEFAPFVIAILIALSVHEFAHGLVARRLGDPTAETEGRLTLNPLAHLDPLGTLMFLFVGFGWGKPVPVNPLYFRHPKRDTALVSLAGPVSNLLLAWIGFSGLVLLGTSQLNPSLLGIIRTGSTGGIVLVIEQILRDTIFINLALMAFNLLPIAPLDGSKVLHMFIPLRYEDAYVEFMRRGPFILLLLLIADQLLNIPILFGWIMGIVGPVVALMNAVGG
ncbi:site-2 protease family protein [Candidatus Peregrinibacteria bacterium CG10_big_fil_rev_8_21_14_0_10_55_24]|nr:MAG: site-2 protease family protein [Candidatus Peregrinibacteria bacterium CG10_big_fil_rev_8_21_14_0_10_55_24]